MAKRKISKRIKEAQKFKQSAWRNNPIPPRLFKAYKKCSEDNFEDERTYAAYTILADKYLGKDASDRLEQGKLIVCLTRMRLGKIT
jgi:hypothetical protein